ncbi:MAG TPA: TlpA family protein disulfide reductase, partial [candidate division Zixibacteria bacterium]|nr:TlpA family protein disulfide reductase [candidate division Zixibacteria bacterium]
NRTAFPIVFDSTGRLAKLYELEAMPTSFLYDRSGRLVSTHRGFRPDETDSLEAAIVRLLDKGGAQ